MYALNLVALLGLYVLFCVCQTSRLVVNVIEVRSIDVYTLVCKIPPSTNLTRWTFLSGSTGTLLMSYQNGRCTVSPSESFLIYHRYSYTCNSTIHQVTIYPSSSGGLNNHILACRDAVQPDSTGSTWMIKTVTVDEEKCNCDQTITFSIKDTTEGHNVTFICRVSSDVPYVNWNMLGSHTAAMTEQNGQCITQGTTFLDYASKYIYTCNHTVYQVTRLNIQRSEHKDMYMCTPTGHSEGTGSNWIIKIKAPVTSVTLTPSISPVNVIENTAVEFVCTTSTARPAAFIYWYRHPNRKWQNVTQITNNITKTTDYNDLSLTTSILRFVPRRQDNDTRIYCKANNSVSTNIVSTKKILLNVLYKAEDAYILQGSEFRVIENTPGTLSCTVKGGNPTPTLSWSCNNFSSTNQTTININENVTTTLAWNVSTTHEGTCTCTSTQTSFTTVPLDVSLVVLYPPSKPMFRVYGGSVVGDILFIEGNTRSKECTADSKPSPDRYTWTGPRITGTVDIQSVTFSNIRKTDAGEYKCSVHNTMTPSNGNALTGINSRAVNVAVLYPPSALYFVYGNLSGQNISNNVIDVMKGDTFDIVCKSIDGVPSPMFKWYDQNDNSSVLRVDNILESRTNATCTATNYMKETNREVVKGNVSDTIRFNILIRPTINICEWYYNANPTDVIAFQNDAIDTLMIMENESFTLKCSAEGKPTPNVWWNIPQRSLVSSSLVTVNNLTRHMKGDYVFTANSLLEPSFKGKYKVTVSKTVSVHVLYPPAILPMNDIAKLKYEQFNLMCNYTTGMPEITSIKWTRDLDDRVWNTAALNIESLENSDTGIYTCTASNIMKQSGDSKSYIDAAIITSFTIDGYSSQTVTVNESDPVRFICTADSNPTAVMTVRHESKTLVTVTSNSVEYNIAKAGCSDEGIFYCSARNIHHESTDILQLFVNCTDIPSPIPVPLIGGIAGGVTGCIIIVVVIIFIIRRYSLSNNSAEEQAKYNAGRLEDKTIENNDATTYDEIGSVTSRNNSSAGDSAYNTVSSVHNYEMVNLKNVESTPYLPLDQTEQHNVMTPDTTKDEYENMKIQVF